MSRINKNEYLNYAWSDLGEVICHLEDAGCDDLVEEAKRLRRKISKRMGNDDILTWLLDR